MTSNFDITHDCTSLATADITAILHLVFSDKAIAMTADNNNVSQNIVDLGICPWCISQPTSMERQGEKTALHNIFIAALHCIAMSVMPIGTYVLIAPSMKSIHFFTGKEEVDERRVIGGKKSSWNMYSCRRQSAVMYQLIT
jgi:hypothetical protein